MDKFDIVVIGAGPGGYVAAIRAAQLGLSTACVDAWVDSRGKPALGGTCLNVGCIPSKALLDSSHHYHNLRHLLPAHGIEAGDVKLDLRKMLARKDKVVRTLTRGVAGLLRKNKIESIAGLATLAGGGRVEVALHGSGGSRSLTARHIVLATGSVPDSHPRRGGRRGPHRRQRRRPRLLRSAEAARHHRRRGHRPGARQRVGAARLRGDDPGSARRLSPRRGPEASRAKR